MCALRFTDSVKENKWECIKELPVSLRKPISFIYNDHLHIIGIETEGDSEFLRIFSLSDDFDKWKEVGGRFFTESKNEINNFQTLPTDKPNELWLYVRHGWMIMNNTFLKLDLINQEMICDWEIEFENSDRDDKIYVENDFLTLLKMRNNNLYKVNFDLINLVPQFSLIEQVEMRKLEICDLVTTREPLVLTYEKRDSKSYLNRDYINKIITFGKGHNYFQHEINQKTGEIEVVSVPIGLNLSKCKFCRLSGNEIFCVSALSFSYVYNLSTREITCLPKFDHYKDSFKLLYSKGVVYAIDTSIAKEVYQFDLKIGKWEAGPPLKLSIFQGHVFELNEMIGLICDTFDNNTKIIQILNFKKRRWEVVRYTPPIGTKFSKLLTFNSKIILFDTTDDEYRNPIVVMSIGFINDITEHITKIQKTVKNCIFFHHPIVYGDKVALLGRSTFLIDLSLIDPDFKPYFKTDDLKVNNTLAELSQISDGSQCYIPLSPFVKQVKEFLYKEIEITKQPSHVRLFMID